MITINKSKVCVKKYPDGTQNIHINNDILFTDKRDNVVVWNYESDEEMVTLLYVSEWIGDKKGVLYMPYIPNARMDRIKNSDEIFTLKSFCKFINMLGYKKVFVLDPHSDVSAALLDNVVYITPDEYIKEAIKRIDDKDIVMFYPDNGAAKRYGELIDKPYCYGVKNRDWKTGKILELDVVTNGIDIKNKNILIVDDICSKGGTFYYSALKLKELGVAKIYLYVTHCENTIAEGELLKDNGLIDRIFTTNSIYTLEEEKVEVIND